MYVFTLLFLGGWGFFALFWAFVKVLDGQYLAFVALVGLAAFCFGIAIQSMRVQSRKVFPEGRFDADGSTILPDRWFNISLLAGTSGLVLAMAVIAVFVPMRKLDLPMSGPPTSWMVITAAAAGTLYGLPLVINNLRHRTTKYLRMTPDGVEIYEGRSPVTAQWDQIRSIGGGDALRDPSQATKLVVMMDGGKTATLSGGAFTPEGTALRDLVRFYWQHPENRGELTNGAALQRLDRAARAQSK